MLRSYEAIYDHGQLRWVNDAPKETPLRVIVTVIDEAKTANLEPTGKRRRPPPELAGMMRVVNVEDNLVESAIPNQIIDTPL